MIFLNFSNNRFLKILFCFFVFFFVNVSLFAKNTLIRKCSDEKTTSSLTKNPDYVCKFNGDELVSCTHKNKEITYNFYNVVKTSSFNEAKDCLQNPNLWDYCGYVDYNLLSISSIIKENSLIDYVYVRSNDELCNVYYKDISTSECDIYYKGGYTCFLGSRYCNQTARIKYIEVKDCDTPNNLNLDNHEDEELDNISNNINELLDLDFNSRMDMVCKSAKKGNFLNTKNSVKNYNALKIIKNQNKFNLNNLLNVLSYGSNAILALFKPTNLGKIADVACDITCSNGKVSLLSNKIGVSSFCSTNSLKNTYKKLLNGRGFKYGSELTNDFPNLKIRDLEKIVDEKIVNFERYEKKAYFENKNKELNELFNLNKYDSNLSNLRDKLQENINYNLIENLFNNKNKNELIVLPKKENNPNFNFEYANFLDKNKLLDTNLEYEILKNLDNTKTKDDFLNNLVFNFEKYSNPNLENISNKAIYSKYLNYNSNNPLKATELNNTDILNNANSNISNKAETITNIKTNSLNNPNLNTNNFPTSPNKSETITDNSSLVTSTNTVIVNKGNGAIDVNVKVDDINVKLDDSVEFNDNDLINKQNATNKLFEETVINNYNNFLTMFNNFKIEATSTLDNLKSFNFNKIINYEATSCVVTTSIQFANRDILFSYDICALVSPVKNITYVFFYVLFFILALKIIFKLILRIF